MSKYIALRYLQNQDCFFSFFWLIAFQVVSGHILINPIMIFEIVTH